MDADARLEIKRLYEAYADDIYRYARLSLQDDEEAYDVVQEVFFRAFKAWRNFRGDASVRTWLISIERNYIRDLLKRKQNNRKFLATYTPPHLLNEQEEVEQVLIIEEAVAALKEEYRQVFILRHVQDLSVRDVAQILGWSPGKVRITDFRAITKLRDGLTKLPDRKGVNNRHEYNT